MNRLKHKTTIVHVTEPQIVEMDGNYCRYVTIDGKRTPVHFGFMQWIEGKVRLEEVEPNRETTH